MALKRKTCEFPYCENPVWSNKMCKNHVPVKDNTFYGGQDTVNSFKNALSGLASSGFKKKESPTHSPLKKTAMKSKPYNAACPQNILKKEQTRARYELFLEIWSERGAKSEVSNTKLRGEPSSAYFHHIIPKGKYPPGDLDPNNIIIMTMDEHANVESNIYRYDEVNKRRELLNIKYNL